MDYVADLDDVIAQAGAPARDRSSGTRWAAASAATTPGYAPSGSRALALLEGLGPPDMANARWSGAHRDLDRGVAHGARARQRRCHARRGGARACASTTPCSTRRSRGGSPRPGRAPCRAASSWKHDPLHLTFGPYAYRLETAIKYWQRVTCPVLIVDGAQSTLNLPDAERAARRAHFANHRHVVLAGCRPRDPAPPAGSAGRAGARAHVDRQIRRRPDRAQLRRLPASPARAGRARGTSSPCRRSTRARRCTRASSSARRRARARGRRRRSPWRRRAAPCRNGSKIARAVLGRDADAGVLDRELDRGLGASAAPAASRARPRG